MLISPQSVVCVNLNVMKRNNKKKCQKSAYVKGFRFPGLSILYSIFESPYSFFFDDSLMTLWQLYDVPRQLNIRTVQNLMVLMKLIFELNWKFWNLEFVKHWAAQITYQFWLGMSIFLCFFFWVFDKMRKLLWKFGPHCYFRIF